MGRLTLPPAIPIVLHQFKVNRSNYCCGIVMRLHSCAGCVARSPLHDTLASATAAAACRAFRQGDMALLTAEHMISYAIDVNAVPQWSVASTFRRTRRAVFLSCASSSSSRSNRTTASRSTTVGLGVLLPATRLSKMTKLVGSRCRKPAAWSPVLPDPEHRMRRDVLEKQHVQQLIWPCIWLQL